MTPRRLRGRVVAVTRADASDDSLTVALESEGARVPGWPCLSFLPPAAPDVLAEALINLDRWDWVVITSPRAVEAMGKPSGMGPPPRIAAVGPRSAAALESAGWPVALRGSGPGARKLGQTMTGLHPLAGAKVLFPAGSRANDTLKETLTAAGAEVTQVEAYRTLVTPPQCSRILADLASGVDAVTFASPSAVEAIDLALEGDLSTVLGTIPAVVIGPTTAAPLLRAGVARVIVARRPAIPALVDAVAEVLSIGRA